MVIQKGRRLSIYMLASLAFASVNASIAQAQSVAHPNVMAGLSSGVSSAAIQSAISSANYINLSESVINTRKIAPLYQTRGYQPIFVSGTSATENLAKLKSLVDRVHLLGLDRSDYWNQELNTLTLNLANAQTALQAELLAAQILVSIASDAATGRAELQSIDQETDFRKSTFDSYQTLNSALNSFDLLIGIEQLEPKHQEYADLKRALAKLYTVKANGTWDTLRGSTTLKPGATSSDVPGIRQRLVDLNYLPAQERSNSSTTYDRNLAEAVKAFQRGMKLDPDGVCGRMCFGALNTSVDQRIAQVNVNLERWRWLPKSLGNKYVFVNLARQELIVRENGVTAFQMNTVNGQLLRRTPTMVDRIYEIVINPTWTVPNSIAIKDIIPKQIKNPSYMASANIRVYSGKTQIDPKTVNWASIGTRIPYTFVQDPGPHNSLGTVKFSLTNSRAIYLHDTPHPEDFPLVTRLKSSGCVRLERPHELAEYLLRGTEWDLTKIRNTISNYKMYPLTKVKLKTSVPTYLTYLTASVGAQGQIQFSPDYYGQDQRLINASKSNQGF